MRKLFFILVLVGYVQITLAQTYEVEINNHRTGSFKTSTETGQNIDTFTTLDFQVHTLNDTLKYFSKSHFVESDSGFLESVEWKQIFQDTIRINQDFKDTIVFGPERIRRLSLERLDSVDDMVCYPTYSPELGQIVEVKRELVGYAVVKAQKLKIVKETIGKTSTISKYDSAFRIIEASYPSPYGKIRLIRVNQIRRPQFFESSHFEPHRVLSNIRFPDPNQITSLKLNLKSIDTLDASSLIYHNQKIINQDSTSITLMISNEKETYTTSDSIDFLKPEIIWSKEKISGAIDSSVLDSLTNKEKIEALKKYASKQPYPNLSYYQLLLDQRIPARIVGGYAYHQWFWTATYWLEIVVDNYWTIQDLLTKNSSSALKVAFYKSNVGEALSKSYFNATPKIAGIKVQSYTLNGKKQAVSTQALPYYFESPIYENEGLGIRFQIPDGFFITNDGTELPSAEFLALENEYNERIRFKQIVTSKKKQTVEHAQKEIINFLQSSESNLKMDKKSDFWYGSKGQKGAIAIPQGKSFILITIEHEDPEFIILVLTKKNLQFKY